MELQTQKRHVDDELVKLKGGVQLDMNLEKSRAKEAVSTMQQWEFGLILRTEKYVANTLSYFL